MRLRDAFAATLAVVAMTAPTGARSAGVEEFYKGRTISLIIGYSVGSGYDIYARLLARFIGRHIPGRPTVVAQNMPGAGSMKAANYVYQVAPKDGTALGVIVESAALEQADRVADLIAEFHDQYPNEHAGTPFKETAQA